MGVLPKNWAVKGARRSGLITLVVFLGHAYARTRRLDEARIHLDHALSLFDRLGDKAGQSYAHNMLGMTFHSEERYDEALTHMQQAVDLAQADGSYPRGLAAALNSLGWVHALRGDAEKAIAYCGQALGLSRDLKDRWGEAASLDSIGYAYHHLGRHREAVRYFEQALAINRELGHLYSEALDYDHLGDALDAAGDAALARDAWQRALEILGQLGDVYSIGRGYPDPDVIRAKLRTRDPGGQRAY